MNKLINVILFIKLVGISNVSLFSVRDIQKNNLISVSARVENTLNRIFNNLLGLHQNFTKTQAMKTAISTISENNTDTHETLKTAIQLIMNKIPKNDSLNLNKLADIIYEELVRSNNNTDNSDESHPFLREYFKDINNVQFLSVVDTLVNETKNYMNAIKRRNLKEWNGPDHINNSRRIFQAVNVRIQQYPFVASIHVMGEFVCGGAIINRGVVITAASCVRMLVDPVVLITTDRWHQTSSKDVYKKEIENFTYWINRHSSLVGKTLGLDFQELRDLTPPIAYQNDNFLRTYNEGIAVRIGSDYIDRFGELCFVYQIYFNPNFDLVTLQNNLAILMFQTDLRLSTKKKIRRIPYRQIGTPSLSNIKSVTLLGWGDKGSRLLNSNNKLSFSDVNIYDLETCKDVYSRKFLSDTNFCTGDQIKGSGACQHDVGSPGIFKSVLVGLVSFGPPVCGLSYAPTAFTDVTQYVDWIDSVIQQKPPQLLTGKGTSHSPKIELQKPTSQLIPLNVKSLSRKIQKPNILTRGDLQPKPAYLKILQYMLDEVVGGREPNDLMYPHENSEENHSSDNLRDDKPVDVLPPKKSIYINDIIKNSMIQKSVTRFQDTAPEILKEIRASLGLSNIVDSGNIIGYSKNYNNFPFSNQIYRSQFDGNLQITTQGDKNRNSLNLEKYQTFVMPDIFGKIELGNAKGTDNNNYESEAESEYHNRIAYKLPDPKNAAYLMATTEAIENQKSELDVLEKMLQYVELYSDKPKTIENNYIPIFKSLTTMELVSKLTQTPTESFPQGIKNNILNFDILTTPQTKVTGHDVNRGNLNNIFHLDFLTTPQTEVIEHDENRGNLNNIFNFDILTTPQTEVTVHDVNRNIIEDTVSLSSTMLKADNSKQDNLVTVPEKIANIMNDIYAIIEESQESPTTLKTNSITSEFKSHYKSVNGEAEIQSEQENLHSTRLLVIPDSDIQIQIEKQKMVSQESKAIKQSDLKTLTLIDTPTSVSTIDYKASDVTTIQDTTEAADLKNETKFRNSTNKPKRCTLMQAFHKKYPDYKGRRGDDYFLTQLSKK